MKKMNKIGTRAISLLLSMAIVFAAVASYSPKVKAKTISSLKSEYSEIQDKVSESESKVKELESQKAEQQKIISALNDQIEILNEQLDNVTSQKSVINDDIKATESKITNLNNEIADLDRQIEEKNTEIDATVQLFCERMRANYMAGETSVLEIFTTSSDLSSFLNRIEMFKRVTETDQGLVDQLHEEIDSIKTMQKELEDKKAALVTEKKALEDKKADLQTTEDALTDTQSEIMAKSSEVNKKLKELNYQTQTLKVSVDEYNKQMDKIDSQITALIKAQASSSSGSGSSSGGSTTVIPSSSGWVWPIPYSGCYISSPYGYRSDPATGSYKFHGGIDITMGGIYGKKIIATRSGRVITAAYTSTGYGNYVILDHGDGYVSLYGHCSSLAVSAGETVKQGQTIAYVGSSGYSTGAHCHFEIRYNSERVNPLNYVKRP